MDRECVTVVNMFVILSEKLRLKMRLLIFLKHIVDVLSFVSAVVTVKISIYYISFLFSLPKCLANLEVG